MLIIKDVIKRKGYSVTTLAEKLGMTQVSLSRIINGNPTVETLEKIANALEVDVKDLFASTMEHESETLYINKEGKYIPIGTLRKFN
ncbi:helix-turn-helix domain-containing protein [Zhouia sp. PK063]|uniref:helix-turn-helix domain-containing protein n=1 Tax=Zhouia sp. PK063 TaxID=3373602 RepID=UPI0037A3A576